MLCVGEEVKVSMCVRERERVCVCVRFVSESEREREREVVREKMVWMAGWIARKKQNKVPSILPSLAFWLRCIVDFCCIVAFCFFW